MSEPGRVLTPQPEPWTTVNGRRVPVPFDALPAHLTPCASCGRILRYAGPGDVCGACLGSVCDA